MIRKLIRTIRHKPKAVKNNIALGLAAVLTLAVALVWFGLTSMQEQASEEVYADEQSPGFSQFFDSFSKQVEQVKESGRQEADESEVGPAEENLVDLSSIVEDGLITGGEVAKTASGTENSEVLKNEVDSVPVEPREVRIISVRATTSSTTVTSDSQ